MKGLGSDMNSWTCSKECVSRCNVCVRMYVCVRIHVLCVCVRACMVCVCVCACVYST